MKWLRWRHESKEVLQMIANKSEGNPGQSMRLLQMAYINLRAKDKEIIEIRDVEEAVGLLARKSTKGK